VHHSPSKGLCICAGASTLVDNLSFSVQPGEVLALIGESGSGKTTTALALMGYARDGCRIAGGSVRIGDTDVLALDARAQRALRGRTVAYIAQSAAASFNPSRTIMDQVVEPTVIHGLCKRAEAEAKAVQLFRELALPDPGRHRRALSAPGLRRPAAAADGGDGAHRRPRPGDPRRADHGARRDHADRGAARLPPRGARAPRHRGVREPRPRGGGADGRPHPGAAQRQHARAERDRADPRRAGRRLHQEPAGRRRPVVRAPAPAANDDPELLLEVRQLSAGYGPVDAQGRPAKPILEDIDLKLYRGQAIGVIGESGSGKTTLARAVAGLLAPSSGSVLFHGRELKPTLQQRERDELRRIQIVFQMADTALNPSQTIERILARPLQFYKGLRGEPLRGASANCSTW
jgi:peptide/nickel transport system ATP-binding protein